MAALIRCLFRFSFIFGLLFTFSTVIHGQSTLIHLDEDNWNQMLDGEWMVEFFAPWCPACKGLQAIWEDFSSWSRDLGIHVAQIDVTTNPGLSGRFMVTALPTIFHVKDGQFRQYRGPRDREEFMSFIEEKKWIDLEEISKWKSPNSIQMSIVSAFFKISMILRNVHTQLVEGYGLPYWVSLLLFGLVTVLVGAFLGLMLVCIVDVVFPPKTFSQPPVIPSPALSEEPVTPEAPESPSKKAKSPKSPGKVKADDKPINEASPSRSIRKRKVINEEQ